MKDRDLFANYNCLKAEKANAKIDNKRTRKPIKSGKEEIINRDNIIINIDIVYSFLSIIFLRIISTSRISSIEAALQIIIPTLFITVSSCYLVRMIDQVLDYKNVELLSYIEGIQMYNYLLYENEAVINELEHMSLLQFNDTLLNMKLIPIECLYSSIVIANEIYILTGISKEIQSTNFNNWIDKLVSVNDKFSIKFLLTGSLTTQGRDMYIQSIQRRHPGITYAKRINERKNYYWAHACDIICVVGETTNDITAYLLLGTDTNAIYRKIDCSYVSETYLAQVLGRIQSIWARSDLFQ